MIAVAGIGFELKKLFKNKGYFYNTRAYFYAAIVTVAPVILCTLMITAAQTIISFNRAAFLEKELFLASVVYAFIFSQIITSGFSMVITRYISDRLYAKEYGYILPSLYGVLSLCIPFAGVLGIVFYYFSPLEFGIKLISYMLYIELIILWIQTVYLSALKDYIKIAKAFLYGVVLSIIMLLVFIYIFKSNVVFYAVLSVVIGVFLSIVLLMFYIEKFFKENNNKYFHFLTYFDKYPALFFVNLFYTVSLYVHNFVFWNSELKVEIYNTYVYAPLYDAPVFYAFLTGLPSLVVFVVSVETVFYDKYKNYYSLITGGGILKDIERGRKSMTNTLWQEIIHLMKVQLFFSVFCIFLGNIILPKVGIVGISINIYKMLVLAVFCNFIFLSIMLIQLYFEDRKGALLESLCFLTTNILLSILSIKLGEDFYGVGFFLSAFITLFISLIRLSYFIKNINYYTFCSQPIIYKERKGIFTWLAKEEIIGKSEEVRGKSEEVRVKR